MVRCRMAFLTENGWPSNCVPLNMSWMKEAGGLALPHPKRERMSQRLISPKPEPSVIVLPVVELITLPVATCALTRAYCWKPPRTSARVWPILSLAKSALRGSVVTLAPAYAPRPRTALAALPSRIIEMIACLRANGVKLAYQSGFNIEIREPINRGEKKKAFIAGAQCSTGPRSP